MPQPPLETRDWREALGCARIEAASDEQRQSGCHSVRQVSGFDDRKRCANLATDKANQVVPGRLRVGNARVPRVTDEPTRGCTQAEERRPCAHSKPRKKETLL